MKAVIMAGGEGSRLRPLTCSVPKPMTEICNIPIMHHIIELLCNNGITQIAATLQYLPDAITDYFSDGTAFGANIKYFEEKTPLGTAGGVKNCEEILDESFIVISGDGACSFDLKSAIAYHKRMNSDATLLLTKTDEPTEYGVVVTNDDGRITRFVEKPSWSRVYSDNINTGIYILEQHVLNMIPKNKFYDFGKDLFPKMLKEGMKLYGCLTKGYWCDIGSPEAYLMCNTDALDGRYICKIKRNIPVIDKGAIIHEPVVFGKNVSVGAGAVVGPYAVIGDNCKICDGASIKRSVVYNDTHIGALSEIRGAVIGKRCALKDNVRIFEGSIIGDSCIINDKVLIDKNVKIWPAKTIAENLKISTNIIWGDSKKDIFDDDGIKGDTLVDMTPAVMVKLGIAAGLSVDNKIIITAVNNSVSSNMLLYAFISGVMSTGCKVYNAGNVPECVWKFAVLEYGGDKGAYISERGNKSRLYFCNEYALSLTHSQERKIEAAFLCDESTKQQDIIYDIKELSGIFGIYEASLVKLAKSTLKGQAVLIHCPDKELFSCIKNALSALGCELKEGGPVFYLSPDGGILSCSDELGLYHSNENTAVLSVLSCGKDEVSIPYNFPISIDKIAQNRQMKINRICEDEGLYSKVERVVYDGCASIINILTAMVSQNVTLHEMMNEAPQFYTSVIYTDTEMSKSEIMNVLTHSDEKKELLDGVRILLERGNVLISPMKKSKRFKIIAESESMETANEICSDFSEIIKKIKKRD